MFLLSSDPRLCLVRSSIAGAAVLLSSCVSAGCTADNQDSAPRPDYRIGVGRVLRLAPSMDEVIPHTATIEKLATGFEFIEGPVWR